MIWLIADTHFFHYLPNLVRPFVGFEMDELLIKNWNECVKSGDDIYHLGDFALGKSFPIVQILFNRLNGNKILIKGNHDNHGNKITKLKWGSIHDVLMITGPNKEKIWLSHYAHLTWPQKGRGAMHCFGHSHGKLKGVPGSMDVGVDANNYKPVSLDEVVSKLKPELDDYIKLNKEKDDLEKDYPEDRILNE